MNPRIELCIAFMVAFGLLPPPRHPRISRAVLLSAKRQVRLSGPAIPINSGSHSKSSTTVAGRAVCTRSVGRSSSSRMVNAPSK